MEDFGSHFVDFHESWYLKIFQKSVSKIQVSLKSDQDKGYCHIKTNLQIFIISCSVFLWMINVSDKSCRENQTHILCSVVFLFKIVPFMRMENYCRAGQATVDSMAHTHFMLDTWGYAHRDLVMLIAFPLHHWLHECTSLLCYMYIASLVAYVFRWYRLLKFIVQFQLKGKREGLRKEDHVGVEMKKKRHLFLVCQLSCQLI